MNGKRHAASLLLGVLLAACANAPASPTPAGSSPLVPSPTPTQGHIAVPPAVVAAESPGPAPAPTPMTAPPLTPGPQPTPTTPVATPAPTAALEDPVVGRMAAVVTDTRLVVRSKPGTGLDSNKLGWYLYPRQRAEVLKGPVLASGYPWYRIRVNEDVGWVAGRSRTGQPWLAKATVQAIGTGGSHACALTSGGGVLCWGDNRYGELGDGTTTAGDGTTTATAGPVDVAGFPSGVTAIAAGSLHTCALTSGGGVACWGANYAGELGDGTTSDRHAPVAVVGLSGSVTALAAGSGHTCALTSGGAVKCWGENSGGQLGNGTTARSSSPVEVTGLSSGVTAIAAGSGHTCALTSGGGVTCWGHNASGQLGDGKTTDSSTPVAVVNLASDVTAVTAGMNHTCALTARGGVTCWGSNHYGQLGAATALATGMRAISAGDYHTCGLTSGGEVRCWGTNSSGQLGNGTTAKSSVPVGPFGLAGGVTAVAAGGARTCAITGAGGVKCWGSGSSVQFVGGPKADNTRPSDVDFSIHQTITLQRPTPAARVPAGSTVTFTATVAPPAPAGARATVQFSFRHVVDGRLVVVARRDVRVAANGQATLKWTSSSIGQWFFVRAWAMPNESQPASGWSREFAVKVVAVR